MKIAIVIRPVPRPSGCSGTSRCRSSALSSCARSQRPRRLPGLPETQSPLVTPTPLLLRDRLQSPWLVRRPRLLCRRHCQSRQPVSEACVSSTCCSRGYRCPEANGCWRRGSPLKCFGPRPLRHRPPCCHRPAGCYLSRLKRLRQF